MEDPSIQPEKLARQRAVRPARNQKNQSETPENNFFFKQPCWVFLKGRSNPE
jgi:hypothetical protein